MLCLGKFQSPHTWSAMNVGEGIVRGTVGPGTRWRQRGVEGRIRPYQREKERERGDQVHRVSVTPLNPKRATTVPMPSFQVIPATVQRHTYSFSGKCNRLFACYDCNIAIIPSIRATLIITDQLFTVLPVVVSRRSWWSVSTMGDVAVPPSTLPGVT